MLVIKKPLNILFIFSIIFFTIEMGCQKKLVKMLVGGISNSGLKSKLIIYKEELKAFRLNEIEVNPFLFLLYKAKKIIQFF